MRNIYLNVKTTVVPNYVANWFEQHKNNLDHSIKFCTDGYKSFTEWFRNTDDSITTLIKMSLFGYEIKKESTYTVDIPIGNGFFKTVCQSGTGKLILSDKNYQSKDKIKQHNNHIPGGLTENVIKDSELSWVWQFAKEVKNNDYHD
nr:MAG TPA: Protein of unknown function (DUF1642) [Caudoviricetes sp.]